MTIRAVSDSTVVRAGIGRTATASQIFNPAADAVVVQSNVDPYYKYVSMLLSGDGMSTSPFNADASTNAFNLSINGDVKPDRFNPYQAGYYGNYFDGTSDYLSIGANAAFALGTGDFTVECWINSTELTSDTYYRRIYMTDGPTGNASGNFQIAIAPTSGYVNAWDGTLDLLGTSNVCNGQWNHIAVTRSGTTLRIFVNGTQQASTTYSASVSPNGGTPRPYIGTYSGTTGDFSGYISNLRVVKGTAVYTANFTPSTTPLTAISGTSLLTCQSHRFLDSSANNFTITLNGNVTVSYFQPFTVSSSYADYGSGYFDGSGDYLNSSTWSIGTANFTAEAWVYITNTGTSVFGVGDIAGATGFAVYRNSSGYWVMVVNGTVQISSSGTSSVIKNQWNHVALVRSSGSTKLYINGAALPTTYADTNSYSGTMYVGANMYSGGIATDYTGYISDARFVNSAVYTTNFTPPSSPLTAITNTQLLTLQTNGGANDSGFVDSSPNNFLVTRNGNPTQGSFSPYGDNWSNYFNASSANTDYLVVPASNSGNFGTGEFTIEFWINPLSDNTNWANGGNATIADTDASAGTGTDWWVVHQVNQTIVFASNSAVLVQTSNVITGSTWHHVAIVRSGTTITIYVDGTNRGSSTYATTIGGNRSIYLTTQPGFSRWYKGYFSNFRIVKGTAVYTGNFTPPSAPLTAITNTSLLTCQSNRFKDNSANNFTLTVNGNTSVQRFNPFGTSTAYSAATIGGSGYFDGNGDYLSVANTTALILGTGDFTIECWVYPLAVNGSNANPLINKLNGGSNTGWLLGMSSTSLWQFSTGSTVIVRSGAVSLNTWTHLAAVRSSGTTTLYVNGTSVGSTATAFNFTDTVPLQFAWESSFVYCNAYISDARVVKGTAVYTGNFTPPSAPLTPVTNTQLLLSMTNAGIYDNAMMADLETVGNAQVSTTQKKYGTGSMYFDGTGDWLAAPATPQSDLGSGDFTIECWLYRTAGGAGSDSGIVSRGAPSNANGFVFAYTSSNVLTFNFNYSGAIVTGSTTIPVNTWTHVAVTRSGTTFRLYVNGTVDATATSSNAQTLNANDIFYVGRSGYDSSRIVTGYIDDLRITKGYARYSGNFTAPTQEYPNVFGYNVPGAPTSVSATAGNAQATVSFTAPSDNGGAAITSYTVTSSPGGITASGSASPITVTGLTNGTTYTFTVTATNSAGTGSASSSSSGVTPIAPPSTVEYLVVAGGGGAGGVSGDASGGGGAGGYRTATGYAVSTGSPITVTVGGGGNGGGGGGANDGTQGSSSVFGTITSAGGGYGGGGASGGSVQRNGGSGGSGGGSSNTPATAGSGNTPSTSPAQGYNGGTTYGGGGGAGGAGSATAFNGANNGGAGATSSISGSSVNYAGGGCSGGSRNNTYGGGHGEYNVGAGNNTAGTANTGGGGGGAWNSGTRAGGNGGSGIVIIRYADTYAAAVSTTGSPTITVAGGYRIYKWTGSGSITF